MTARAITLIAALLCSPAPRTGEGEAELRLYVPRSVRMSGDSLTLGAIAIVRSQNADLAAKASAVAMGRPPLAGESIVIDRRTILSRLSASGIPARSIRITGAPQVAIRRNETTVGGKELLRAAEKLLSTRRPREEGVSWRLTGKCGDLLVPDTGGKWVLRAKLVKGGPSNHAKVHVGVVRGGKEIASRDLLFKSLHLHRLPVAVRDIPAGERITPQNTEIRTVERDRPAGEEFTAPFGMIATTHLKSGTVIRPGVLRAVRPKIMVKRNQTVVMRIVGRGFTVSGLGKAMEDGRTGETIRVRNVDTKRIVAARVEPDGTVRPIIKR